MTRLRHGLDYMVFLGLQGLLLALPLRIVQRLGAWVGVFVGEVLRYRRHITLDNLGHAFPALSDQQIRRYAKSSYASVGTTLFEFAWFPRLTERRFRDLVTTTGEEALRTAFRAGKGVVVVTAHFGSWEILGQVSRFVLELPGALLVRGLTNPFVNRRVDAMRRRYGNSTVPSTLAIRELLRTLTSGGWVLMAADQSAPREGIMVPFFGREVSTFQGPATLALRTGAQMVLGLARRGSDGRYVIRFERIPSTDLGTMTPQSVRELTERHVRMTELLIREAPEQWMWMHRRWKHLDPTSTGDRK
ncbi:MAG: lysophospholipid acyltransferase family protein [Bacteroidota bacterium]